MRTCTWTLTSTEGKGICLQYIFHLCAEIIMEISKAITLSNSLKPPRITNLEYFQLPWTKKLPRQKSAQSCESPTKNQKQQSQKSNERVPFDSWGNIILRTEENGKQTEAKRRERKHKCSNEIQISCWTDENNFGPSNLSGSLFHTPVFFMITRKFTHTFTFKDSFTEL